MTFLEKAKNSLNKNLRIFLSISGFLIIVLCGRLGNLKGLIPKYSSGLFSIICIVAAFIMLATSFKASSYKFIRVIVFLILSAIPISFLTGNHLNVSKQFLIVYSVGLLSLIILFNKEIKSLMNRYKI